MSVSETKQTLTIPFIRIEPGSSRLTLRLKELWEYRELLYFLVWRDVKVRYKQTAIGAAWAIIQPLLTMAVFTLVFDKFAKMPSNGLPYPIFSFAALLPWTYFSRSLNQSVLSIVNNANLITKVYFPRLLLPFSATLAGIIDLAVSFVFLLAMMGWYGITPGWPILTLPVFVFLAILTALSVSLSLGVINVRYRDVGQAIPFLVQIWTFVSPVAYPLSVVPEKWRFIYELNPMVGVIEGFRWALTGGENPPVLPILLNTIIVVVLLYTGIVFFNWMESTFADEV
jgi:lipopolysaccharide transport system permease protein